MKSKRNFSFKKSAALISGIIADSLTTMARYQNESIQRGIDTKTDIKGDPFKKLSDESTLPIRNRRGHGFTPLDTMQKTRKSLRITKMIPAKPANLVAKINMVNKHGIHHNQKGGFKTGDKSMIPGKDVPQRNWFGISKEMKPNGAKYKNYVRIALREVVRSLKK